MSTKVRIHIDEGKELHIAEMRIEGNKITKDYVIMREARLYENELFSSDLPERIKRRLDHLQLFSSVSLPELYLTEAEQAGLSVRVVEGNQNNFDGSTWLCSFEWLRWKRLSHRTRQHLAEKSFWHRAQTFCPLVSRESKFAGN